MKTGIMTVEKWIEVPDNPIQRNTIARAGKANRKHLRTGIEPHQVVSVAQFGKKLFKLDGHTRALLWKEKKLIPVSNILTVMYYDVKSMNEVKFLYKCFDNSMATETSMDRQYGAYKQVGFLPRNEIVIKAPLFTMAKIMGGEHPSIYKVIDEFNKEIRLLDKKVYNKRDFPAGLFTAMMITLKKYGKTAFKFWDMVASENKTVEEVVLIREWLIEKRAKNEMSGYPSASTLAFLSLKMYEQYMNQIRLIRHKEFNLRVYMTK
ncbi:MAG: hypothetical protein DRH26_00585 [Deltaproteobacteria bacterium]|nr:MAG: hypothetical protein DRH26_00585 [Deltaproteobacteria bacterium]